MAAIIKIGDFDDFPLGEGRIVQVGRFTLAVFRAGDNVYAIDNTCPHEDRSLGEGMFENGKVTCPGHGWQFDVATGERILMPQIKVQTYRTIVNETKEVFVELP